MRLIIILTFLIFCIVKLSSIALEGPALTIYDPCNLGVILFDKISETVWRGIVHFELYPHLNEVDMEIEFERQIQLTGNPQNNTMSERDDWHRFIMQLKRPIPKQYFFYLRLVDNSTQVPTVKKFTLNNAVLCNDAIKAAQTIESLNQKSDKHELRESYKHVCGRRALEHAELKSVRTMALAGDWPWHVALLAFPNSTATVFQLCGGNIISSTAVLTAGHCVVKDDGVLIEAHTAVIVAGVNNISDYNQIGRQSLLGQKIALHPGYVNNSVALDLAIVRVKKFRYTAYVQPICLWGPVYNKEDLFGKQATIVGFGRTENNEVPAILRATNTMIQSDTTCLAYDPVYRKMVTEFSICTGYGPTHGINPRTGDSGGGLIMGILQSDHKISYFLRGVLSHCSSTTDVPHCNPKNYVVYTDVASQYSWLYHHSGLKYRSNVLENSPNIVAEFVSEG